MTMHLAQGLSTVETRKPKPKRLTAAQERQMALDCRDHNRRLRQQHRHDEQLTLSQYIDYVNGVAAHRQHKFVPYEPKLGYRRETPQIPSLETGAGNAFAKESPEYTGTLVKGIATMHKSNAVPVIDEEQARDLAHMRR